MPPQPGEGVLELAGPWSAFDEQGRAVALACPGDWSRQPGWKTFAGRVLLRTSFSLSDAQARAARFLDLGMVGDIAEVALNGTALGTRAWAPYIWPIEGAARPGENQLEVWVTNSIANRMEGLQMPSGLLGPIRLRAGG